MIVFGERNFVKCKDESELYECIGYLANYRKRGLRISIESYENKWGVEGRIWLNNIDNSPLPLRNAYSAGTNSCVARLNCNEFLAKLFSIGFVEGNIQDINVIRSNIPPAYLPDFDRGYSL